MNASFADTSFFLALLIEDDEAHEQAAELAGKLDGEVLTTDWVLLELGNFLAKQTTRMLFEPFLEFLRQHPLVTILPPNQDQFDKGLTLYHARPDKNWSLTDCISFEVMRENEIARSLTTDKHFEQAGFIALLR